MAAGTGADANLAEKLRNPASSSGPSSTAGLTASLDLDRLLGDQIHWIPPLGFTIAMEKERNLERLY
ncbi:hypothetical protein DsansV1_C13g0119221 [Dioscorea sansibarensis]